MLRSAALLSAAAAVASAAASAHLDLPVAGEDLPASSSLGSRVLAASRRVGGRRLENNDNGGGDASWIARYSLKFEKCATSENYYGGYFGGEDNQNGNQYGQGFNGVYKQRLVHYKLCPTGSCGACSEGADYVVDMNLFVEAFVESKVQAREQECEAVRENCYYDDEYQ